MFPLGTVALLASCGGGAASPESLNDAAEMMCKCVEDKRAEADPDDMFASDDMHFSFCALDVAIKHSVDCSGDDFAEVLAEKCSDLSDLQKDYAKNAK